MSNNYGCLQPLSTNCFVLITLFVTFKTMAPRLTAEQRQYAQMEAENMRRYEVAFEENSAQLRKNPTELATLYQEYAANAPAEGFMPAHDELPKYVDEAEAAISKPKQKFLEYVLLVSSWRYLNAFLAIWLPPTQQLSFCVWYTSGPLNMAGQ
jgi:hypothetical protein